MGDSAGALRDAEEFIRFQPGNMSGYACRSHIRERQGDLEGAIADMRRALEMIPDIPPARKDTEERLNQLLRKKSGAP